MIAGAFGTIIAVALSGLLYRFGGLSKEEAAERWRWVPRWMINSKTRDVGCSLVTIGWLLAFFRHGPWWTYVLSFGLMWGALSTYWDEVPFNHKNDNFFMHGFFIALAIFPLAIYTGWVGFVIRCITLSLVMGILCALSADADVEELGRGALIAATLPLLLI